jgi:hypothetical protein
MQISGQVLIFQSHNVLQNIIHALKPKESLQVLAGPSVQLAHCVVRLMWCGGCLLRRRDATNTEKIYRNLFFQIFKFCNASVAHTQYPIIFGGDHSMFIIYFWYSEVGSLMYGTLVFSEVAP